MPARRLAYDVVDVFTSRAYEGNPLAVVHGTAGMGTAQLQAIAREFNLSETAFPELVDASSYRVRIFTPETELPFAGHPTVGTAWVLTTPTVGANNTAATTATAAGNLVINEWLANPAPGGTGWVELFNKNATFPVALSGLFFQTDAQIYRYPSLSFIAPLAWLQLFASALPGTNQLDFRLPITGTAMVPIAATEAGSRASAANQAT